jgi:HK97 family phage portal protein
MNILNQIFEGPHEKKVASQVERLNRMYNELSTKSTGDFKVITGTGLTPTTEAKSTLPEIEQLLVQGYKGNTIVHSIIRKVSQVASQIVWTVQESSNGIDWTDEEGEVQEIVNKPNPNMTANEFRMNAMTYLMSTGNAYFKQSSGKAGSSIVNFSDDKTKLEFELLPSNLIKIRTDDENRIERYDYRENGASVTEPLTPEQVSHVKFIDPTLYGHTSHLGMSPLIACWNVLKASNNLAIADASMLENKGVLGILSNKSEVTTMTEKEREDMQSATDGLLGGAEKFAKTLVSGTPIDYTSIGMSSSDLQMIEGGVYKDRIICTAFGVSSTMFNDQASSTLDNMKVAEKKLYTDSAIPNNDVLLRAYEQGILSIYEQRTGLKYRIIQDTSGIEALQVDKLNEAEKNAKNTASILSILQSNIPSSMKLIMLVDMFKLDEVEIEKMIKEAEAAAAVVPVVPINKKDEIE